MTTIDLPDFKDVIDSIQDIETNYDNQTRPIREWIKINNDEIERLRKADDIEIFCNFGRDILMRATKGEIGEQIQKALQNSLHSMDDVTYDNLKQTFSDVPYHWRNQAPDILISVKDVIKYQFNSKWDQYFKTAEEKSATNFVDDPMLKIKDVGYKVRDLALSSFSKDFVALDVHIVKMIKKTGLICYAYNFGIDLGTNVSDKNDYLNIRKLLYHLSKDSNYALSEIDRAFWHFGRTICKTNKPKCDLCPVEKCLSRRKS